VEGQTVTDFCNHCQDYREVEERACENGVEFNCLSCGRQTDFLHNDDTFELTDLTDVMGEGYADGDHGPGED